MKIDQITVADRHRTDLGDLSDLRDSIAAHGLLHPVVITEDGRLLAGERRLAACKALGWDHVPTKIATHVTDAVEMLQVERDENTCRKDMTPGEKIALGKALEELERPKAVERKSEAGRSSAPGRVAEKDPFRGTDVSQGDTRSIVAPAVGLSQTSYTRAKQLVNAAEQGDSVAREKVAEMNATGKITAPHREWQDSKRVTPKTSSSSRKYSSVGVASGVDDDRVAPRRRAADRQVVVLSGIARQLSVWRDQALDSIAELDDSVTAVEAIRLTDDLHKSRRALSRVINLLEERSK